MKYINTFHGDSSSHLLTLIHVICQLFIKIKGRIGEYSLRRILRIFLFVCFHM